MANDDAVSGASLQEPDCETASESGITEQATADEPSVDTEWLAVLAALPDDAEAAVLELAKAGCATFMKVGGGWGGSSHTVDRCVAIGRRNGLKLTSRKRSSLSPGSDHHTSQKRADACDLSNGSSPTPAMHRTAREIAAAVGQPGWKGGYLTVPCNGLRMQLIWNTSGHYNHVHVGVRRGG